MSKKLWTTPTIRLKPYEETIKVLRGALEQAERDLSLRPADADAILLRDSLRRMLVQLEGTSAA